MTLSGSHPCTNRVRVGKNDSTFAAHFGMPYAVLPLPHVAGMGHEERLKIACYGGVSLEVSRAFAIELARRLPEAISHMPIQADDIHDHAASGED